MNNDDIDENQMHILFASYDFFLVYIKTSDINIKDRLHSRQKKHNRFDKYKKQDYEQGIKLLEQIYNSCKTKIVVKNDNKYDLHSNLESIKAFLKENNF
jgi:thymidylate kinase